MRLVAIGPEDHVLRLAVRTHQGAKLRKPLGELDAIDVIATGADAAASWRSERGLR